MFRFLRLDGTRALAPLLLTSALLLPRAASAEEPAMPLADTPEAAAKDKPGAAPEKTPALVDTEACCASPRKFPPTTPNPRPGNPTIAPTGPGFYSLFDELSGNFLEKPPKYPYPRFSITPLSFFDADWSYLDNPNNTETDIFDPLKRIHIGGHLVFTTGGEFRFRYANEVDSRLLGVNNTNYLYRTRVYGDLAIGDRLRIFGEYLDAQSYKQDLDPLPIDINKSDILNLFLELKTIDIADDPVYLRVGRQELLYGSQRLISTLDWANTRRTFQGAKAYWHSEKLDVDAFCVQPVIPNPTRFDSVDNNQIFAGLWTTYRPRKGHAADLYYLFVDNTNTAPLRQGINPGPQNFHTIGARYFGQEDCGLMYDAEAAVQVGDKRSEPVLAQAATGGAGWNWKDAPWTPQLWVYYDYASGDSTQGGNTFRTFNQLFPFGHYYFGFIDVVGRQNIHDANLQFTVYPKKWLVGFMQYHVFRLDKAGDALYNAGGVPIRRDPTGGAGNNVGQELDFLVNIHLDKHSDILLSYSHLFIGDFIRGTSPAGNRSPDYFFLQYSYRW